MFAGASTQCSAGTCRNAGWHGVSLYAFERWIWGWNAKAALFHGAKRGGKGVEEGSGENKEAGSERKRGVRVTQDQRRHTGCKYAGFSAYLKCDFIFLKRLNSPQTRHDAPQRPKPNLILMSDQSQFFWRYISCLETTWRNYKLRWERFILSEGTSVRFLVAGDQVQPFLYVYLSWQRLCDSTCILNTCKCYVCVIICRWILWCYFNVLLFSTGSFLLLSNLAPQILHKSIWFLLCILPIESPQKAFGKGKAKRKMTERTITFSSISNQC